MEKLITRWRDGFLLPLLHLLPLLTLLPCKNDLFFCDYSVLVPTVCVSRLLVLFFTPLLVVRRLQRGNKIVVNALKLVHLVGKPGTVSFHVCMELCHNSSTWRSKQLMSCRIFGELWTVDPACGAAAMPTQNSKEALRKGERIVAASEPQISYC